MSTRALELGEALWSGGRIVAVYDQTRQSILQADVAIGATTLGPFDTVAPFNPEGGDVAVTVPDAAGPLTYTYDAVDYDGLTLHLIAGPAVVLPAGSVARPDPVLVDRLADVREGTQADPIACRVPYAMRPWLPVGTREEGVGEEVLYGPTTGAGYVLHDVLGSVPLLVEGGSGVGDMPVGTIMAWPSLTVPARWLACDGVVHLIADYPELFAVIGTTFGGDGVTTFAVPNLTDRFARSHPGGPLGAAAGAASHDHAVGSLVLANEAAHDHGAGSIVTGTVSAHDHTTGPVGTGSAGGHAHASAGGHTHGAGSYGMGGATMAHFTSPGSGQNSAQSGHVHNVNGSSSSSGGHGHGSEGAHTHGVSGPTGTANAHDHGVSGRGGAGSAHAHGISGLAGASSSLPPYLDVLYVIKATPGGDPLADGTYIEVRDEGIPDVPAATALDFRGAGVQVDASGPVAVVTIGAQAGVTDHGALTGLADDDHAQYATNARGDARWSGVAHAHAGAYEPAGAVAGHVAAADPHAAYLTASEAEPAGAVSAHASAADPHSVYVTATEDAAAITTHTSSSPHPAELGELGDVDTPGAASGDVLTYRGGVWHPEAAAGGGGVGAVADFIQLAKGSAQSIPTGIGTLTKINMAVVSAPAGDPAGYWDNVNERMILPQGVWFIHFTCDVGAAASRSGRFACKLFVDGVNWRTASTANDVVGFSPEIGSLITVAEGASAIVEFFVSQNSGGNLTVYNMGASQGNGTWAEAFLVGPLPPALRLPNIVIEVAPDTGVHPLDVDGNVINTGGTVTSYDWDWGDGTAHGAGASVSHTYTAAGTFTVTCTATGPKGTDVATYTVTVT